MLVLAVFAGLLVGTRGAVSAILAGLAVVVPNFLFALRLKIISSRPGASYPAAFFIGEFVKVASTIALLVAATTLYRDVHWLTLLIALIVVLKMNLFAFLLKL